MSKKKQRSNLRPQQDRRAARRRGRRVGWWIAGVAVLAVVLAGGWLVFRDRTSPLPVGALPGPAGGRDVAQDVNTLVGQRAPSFSLATADGRTHAVTPGRGRPTVLVFHMGVG